MNLIRNTFLFIVLSTCSSSEPESGHQNKGEGYCAVEKNKYECAEDGHCLGYGGFFLSADDQSGTCNQGREGSIQEMCGYFTGVKLNTPDIWYREDQGKFEYFIIDEKNELVFPPEIDWKRCGRNIENHLDSKDPPGCMLCQRVKIKQPH